MGYGNCRYDYGEHVLAHYKPMVVRYCPYCSLSFTHNRKYTRHLEKVHKIEVKRY